MRRNVKLVTVPGNERVLTAYRKRAEKEMRDIREIIRELDCSGETYTLSEILNRYRSLPSESGFLYYMKKKMETTFGRTANTVPLVITGVH